MYKINKPTFTNSTSNTSFGIQIIAPSSFVFIKFFVVYNTQLSSTFF